jgi:hypothetical protein
MHDNENADNKDNYDEGKGCHKHIGVYLNLNIGIKMITINNNDVNNEGEKTISFHRFRLILTDNQSHQSPS